MKKIFIIGGCVISFVAGVTISTIRYNHKEISGNLVYEKDYDTFYLALNKNDLETIKKSKIVKLAVVR